MEKKGVFKFTKGAIGFVFWAMLVASIFLVLLIAFAPLLLKLDEGVISASVPVTIGSVHNPRLNVDFSGVEATKLAAAYVSDAQGILNLETKNWGLLALSLIAKLLTAVGLTYLFGVLRNFFRSLDKDEVFTQENCSRLRRLGLGVLLIGILRPVLEYVAALFILERLGISEPALSTPAPFKAEVILGSFLLLVIAQVWSYGLDLKREQDLTI